MLKLFQHQFLQGIFSDIVLRTLFISAVPFVFRTTEVRLVPYYAEIQLCPTVGTVKQSRKHADIACPVPPALALPYHLYLFPYFTVNNRCVGVLNICPPVF